MSAANGANGNGPGTTITATVVLERVALARPITPHQLHVAELLAAGWTYARIATEMGTHKVTVKSHVEQMASRIPGDLSAKLRVIAWFRGAPRYVLEGAPPPTPALQLQQALARARPR